MGNALVLLMLAVQLLTAASQPNVPQSVREAAIKLGNKAILESNAAIAAQSNAPTTLQNQATTSAIIPVITSPVYGSTQKENMAQFEDSLVLELDSEVEQGRKSDDNPLGNYVIRVYYKNANGTFQKDALVTFNGLTRPTDTQYSGLAKDRNRWYHGFNFSPTTPGTHTLTATAGELSASMSLNVPE